MWTWSVSLSPASDLFLRGDVVAPLVFDDEAHISMLLRPQRANDTDKMATKNDHTQVCAASHCAAPAAGGKCGHGQYASTTRSDRAGANYLRLQTALYPLPWSSPRLKCTVLSLVFVLQLQCTCTANRAWPWGTGVVKVSINTIPQNSRPDEDDTVVRAAVW